MDLESLLVAGRGVVGRDELVAELGRSRADNVVRSRTLERVFPRVYAWPWDVDLPEIRQRAALASVGGLNALSHTSTLAAFDLPGPAPARPIHVTAYAPRHPRNIPDELTVHRTRIPFRPIEIEGLAHVPLATALLTSWPLVDPIDRRAPMIEAVRRRLVTSGALRRAARDAWWLPGIREVRELVALVDAGCESMLELWGYTHVFDVPGLDEGSRQRVLRIGDRTVRLDLAYDDEKLAVELDGRRFHSSPLQREKDLARDVLVATCGWQTIRFPHERMVRDVAGVRDDALAVRAARRLRAG